MRFKLILLSLVGALSVGSALGADSDYRWHLTIHPYTGHAPWTSPAMRRDTCEQLYRHIVERDKRSAIEPCTEVK